MHNDNLLLDDMEDVIQLPKNMEYENMENLTYNDRTYTELPNDMRFNEGHVVTIVAYSILMVISAIGNITVLIMTIRRRRKSKSRIHTMVMHLSIADLCVSTKSI